MLKSPTLEWRKTIFFRLIITYILVNIPILLLGVYLYYKAYSNASNNLTGAQITQLNYYLDNLNREIEWLEIQQYELLKDNDLMQLAVTWNLMDEVEKREGLNYILNRIASIKNSSEYIKDIIIHIPSNFKTLSATNSYDELPLEKYEALLLLASQNANRLSYISEGLNLVTVKYGGMNPLYIVQIELNKDHIKDTLQQLNLYPDSNSILYSNAPSFIIGSKDDSDYLLKNYLDKGMGNSSVFKQLKVEDVNYFVEEVYSDKLDMGIMSFLPEKTLKEPLSFFSQWVWLFMISAVIAIIIVYLATYKIIHKPLLLLVQSFKNMEAGRLNNPIAHDKNDEFGYLYSRYNQMLEKLNNLIEQDYKHKMMMQRSELKQLQSQINPHFLYNSFFILNSLAKVGDIDRIEHFTIMLGEYFRFITRNGNDLVYLSEETKHSRVYTNIQELRFSRRIRVQFAELPKEMENIKVPRLIIQPIIENAYKHSLENMAEGGLLRVTFDHLEKGILIIVEDNNDELSDKRLEELQYRIKHAAEISEMTGMINIHRRLQLRFAEGSGLKLERSDLKGLKVTIFIKLPADV